MSLEGSEKLLLLNGVAQFLSSKVTQFVSWEGFDRMRVRQEIKGDHPNYMKNNGNNNFSRGM